MADKTDAQVVIGGRTYTLSGYESEEYLLRIADYLNGKIAELAGDAEYARLTTDMRQLLLNLNIAEDYFRELARNEELQRLVDKKENDLYDIKHDLVAAQMRLQQLDADKGKTDTDKGKRAGRDRPQGKKRSAENQNFHKEIM